MTKRFILSIFALFLLVGFAQPAEAGAPRLIAGATTFSTDQVINTIEQGGDYTLIDSRPAVDYQAAHIETAINITDTEMTEENLLDAVGSKDSFVVFYCNGAACGRAAKAAEKAVGWGFTNIHYYYAGLAEWTELELPLVSD